MLLLTMCLAVLIAQIDTSVVNLAMGAIGRDLAADVAGLQWVLDSYNLTYAVLLLSGGLLADLFGRKRLFLIGMALFTGASLLCAASPGIAVLVAVRALAGAGAALLLPASLAILRVAWTDERARAGALGVWAACNGVAFVIGPPLGGILVQSFGWRSVFLVVVPFGIAGLLLAWRVVPESSNPHGRGFDEAGQIAGAVALGGLALAAIEASHDGGVAAGGLLAALAALVLFIRLERRAGAAAMVPLDLFRQPAFTGALAATAAMTFGMYGLLFALPLVWQASGGLSARAAGLALLPMALVFTAVSTVSGRLTGRISARALIAGGTALIGTGLAIVAMTTAGQPLALAELGLVLTGIGMGLNTGPLYGVAVGAVPPARSGSAASLINVARMIGATIGVAVLGGAFALFGGAAAGLRAAMVVGGIVQLAGALAAWRLLGAGGVRRRRTAAA